MFLACSLCWALLFSGPRISHISTKPHLFCKTSFSPMFACSEIHGSSPEKLFLLETASPPSCYALPLTSHSLLWLGKESSFPQKKGFNCCFFAWGFPQLAQKQSCSTGSTLNFGPQGFPLPAHRWCLPKPSASLMQRAPSAPSLLLTEASMHIWQSKKQPAFLLGSPYRFGSGLNLLQKLNLLVN